MSECPLTPGAQRTVTPTSNVEDSGLVGDTDATSHLHMQAFTSGRKYREDRENKVRVIAVTPDGEFYRRCTV